MHKEAVPLISWILVAVLLIISIIFFLKNKSLTHELNDVKEQQLELRENFKILKENLAEVNVKKVELEKKNINLSEEKKQMGIHLTSAQKDVVEVIDSLNNFEKKVSDSMEWFKENVRMDLIAEYDNMKLELDSCVSYKDSCSIDVRCINEINEEFGFYYQDDLESVNSEDLLKDLVKIYGQNGGDCEDYSLLFRAEYNHLLDKCLMNYSRENVISVSDKKEIEGTYMTVIYGSFDPHEVVGGIQGHCLVGLSEHSIDDSKEVYTVLKKSTLIEPQTGEYVDDMETTDMIKVFDNGAIPDTLHYVWMIITDDDLKIFYEFDEQTEWKGYTEYYTEINNLKTELGQ